MRLKFVLGWILVLFLLIGFAQKTLAAGQAINVTITELASEMVAYDPDNGERNSGTSTTGLTLRSLWLNGSVLIMNIASETISDLNVTFVNTSRMSGNFIVHSQPTYTNVHISSFTAGLPIYVFARELHAGDNITLNYSANPASLGEPINITEQFTKTKVLTNSTFNITINVSNKLTANVAITNLNLTKTPKAYLGANGSNRYFNYTFVTGDDAANASISVKNKRSILEWNVSGGTLAQNAVSNITFGVRAPVDLNGTFTDAQTWSQYMNIGNISVQFLIARTLTDIKVTNITGIAKAQVAVIKTRVNESHWQIGANFTNKATLLDYNLTRVTIWATKYNQFSDPGNKSTWVNNTKQPYANPDSYQSQIIGWEVNNTILKALQIDVNKDRIYYDRPKVFNGTHLLFNLSGNKNIYVKLVNTSGANLNISNCGAVNQVIEINETNLTLAGKTYGSFTINGTCNKNYAITTTMTFFINTTVDTLARYSWYPGQLIQNGRSWQNNTFTFNYSYVPVEWADAAFKIFDGNGTQIFRKYRAMDHSDYGYSYYEEILVLSGYILKASKYIEPSGVYDNVYNVTIVLENIGNDKTPDLITVFDLIPDQFYLLNFTTNNMTDMDNKSLVNNVNIRVTLSNHTRGIYNTGLINNNNSLYNRYWGFRVDLSQFGRGSNGNGAFEVLSNKSEVQLFYMMNGTGQISHIRNAFVIGVDPVRLEGASPQKSVETQFSVDSTSKEILVLLGSIVLSAGILGAAYYSGRREYL